MIRRCSLQSQRLFGVRLQIREVRPRNLNTTSTSTSQESIHSPEHPIPASELEPTRWHTLTPIEEIREIVYRHREDVNIFLDPFARPQGTQWHRSELTDTFKRVGKVYQSNAIHRFAWTERFVEKFLMSPGKGKSRNGKTLVATINDFMDLITPSWESDVSNSSKADIPGPIDVLIFYNAVVARLEKFNTQLSDDVYFWGVFLSAEARSTGGLTRYLRARQCDIGQFAVPRCKRILSSIKQWVLSDLFTGWEGLRRKEALLNLCSGWERNGVRRRNEARKVSLRDMAIATDPWSYLALLAKLGGTDALYDEWIGIKQTWPRITVGDFKETAQDSKLLEVVEGLIIALLQANDPKRAWEVVAEARCTSDDLKESTWVGLLNYPESIRSVPGDMSKQLLRKYEQELEEIERSLGIRWSGGEAGFHVPVPGRDPTNDQGL